MNCPVWFSGKIEFHCNGDHSASFSLHNAIAGNVAHLQEIYLCKWLLIHKNKIYLCCMPIFILAVYYN